MNNTNQETRRQIKFRAWDYEVKTMISSESLSSRIYEAIYGWDNHDNATSLESMQFTGLHDKNGKEIYEGDIVAWDELCYPGGGLPAEGTTRKVKELKWDASITNCGCCDNVHGVGFDFSNMPIEQLEVIGNIYENPELLQHND